MNRRTLILCTVAAICFAGCDERPSVKERIAEAKEIRLAAECDLRACIEYGHDFEPWLFELVYATLREDGESCTVFDLRYGLEKLACKRCKYGKERMVLFEHEMILDFNSPTQHKFRKSFDDTDGNLKITQCSEQEFRR